jgi:hypothetical protein
MIHVLEETHKKTTELRSFLATSKSAIPTNATRSGRKEDRKAVLFSSIVTRDLQVRNTDKRNALGKEGR